MIRGVHIKNACLWIERGTAPIGTSMKAGYNHSPFQAGWIEGWSAPKLEHLFENELAIRLSNIRNIVLIKMLHREGSWHYRDRLSWPRRLTLHTLRWHRLLLDFKDRLASFHIKQKHKASLRHLRNSWFCSPVLSNGNNVWIDGSIVIP